MPHSMKYPTTRLPLAERPTAELGGPAAASGIATATAVSVARAATKRPDVFMSPTPSGGVHKWFVPLIGGRSLSRCSQFVNSGARSTQNGLRSHIPPILLDRGLVLSERARIPATRGMTTILVLSSRVTDRLRRRRAASTRGADESRGRARSRRSG